MKRSVLITFSVLVVIFATETVSASDELLRAAVTDKRLKVRTGKSISRNWSPHPQYEQRPLEKAIPNFQTASRSSILLPDPELLKRQSAPDCQFKSAPSADDDVTLRTIMRLDYEQQCYRQSESILRARMERLQDAIGKTIESLKPSE